MFSCLCNWAGLGLSCVAPKKPRHAKHANMVTPGRALVPHTAQHWPPRLLGNENEAGLTQRELWGPVRNVISGTRYHAWCLCHEIFYLAIEFSNTSFCIERYCPRWCLRGSVEQGSCNWLVLSSTNMAQKSWTDRSLRWGTLELCQPVCIIMMVVNALAPYKHQTISNHLPNSAVITLSQDATYIWKDFSARSRYLRRG